MGMSLFTIVHHLVKKNPLVNRWRPVATASQSGVGEPLRGDASLGKQTLCHAELLPLGRRHKL